MASIFHGVGRRKKSISRAWIKPGKGVLTVNGKDYIEYFDTDVTRGIAATPLKVCEKEKKLDINVNVKGGGSVGQAFAVRLSISRALLKADENLKSLLRKHGLLTVDSRVKERKKYGRKGARRRFQWTKR